MGQSHHDGTCRKPPAVKEGDKTLASFTYRADGMRKTMTTGSQTITFHYDGNNNVIYETDQNNQIVASYTYGANNELVSMTRGGKTYYYQTNYWGDVTALTDSTGEVVATYEYDAFGNLLKETGTVENPYRYAGYRYDEVTGLYYLQSRYYSPETGRFLTRDSFEGFEDEQLSLNRYTYVENNPVNFTDPDGLWKKTIYLRKSTMWKIFATGTGIGVIMAAAGGGWRLAAAILGAIISYGSSAWIGKKGTKIYAKHAKRYCYKKRWSRTKKRWKRYKAGCGYTYVLKFRRWN
ncbi:hypothetical protein GCM10007416_35760 [Kroppenstedtia guangzhouensis]|uniref:Teneurin-like YD-shell domain-containing protein n=1 Tax=Kroppenstedtia guangzhouensis TaxID=1274356 RepID=A0ABQ1H6U3_9BACL|nr:RHS repeat-associated core domain-containing protein [Kroppenstedtia guangzhouensis]GGA59604.1 hypothetical protein GCM10007416_35760 [Kroppenstedtia guangzhouensis]